MISIILNIIGPVALIVLAGFFAVKLNLFPKDGVKFVMNYAQHFAVPLLLFNAVRQVDFSKSLETGILLSYFIPAFIVFLLGICFARFFGRGSQGSVVLGFNALFANSLLLALPICERAFGQESLATNYILLAVHSPIGYMIGTIAMEIAKPKAANWGEIFKSIWRELSHNPLLIGIALGFLINLSGIILPNILDDAITMQSRAALPAALFGLGGVLTSLHLRGAILPMLVITALRMIIHPMIVLVFAHFIFALPIVTIKTLVVIAAMPTGVNGFIFASIYKHEEETAASIVFLGTMISALTLPIWLMVLGALFT